jgi:hypothetical protein
LETVSRKVRVEAEVCRPSRIHDQRYAVGVCDLCEARHIAYGPDVGGVANEHGSRARVLGQGAAHGLG